MFPYQKILPVFFTCSPHQKTKKTSKNNTYLDYPILRENLEKSLNETLHYPNLIPNPLNPENPIPL
jgi:hypothetical protein